MQTNPRLFRREGVWKFEERLKYGLQGFFLGTAALIAWTGGARLGAGRELSDYNYWSLAVMTLGMGLGSVVVARKLGNVLRDYFADPRAAESLIQARIAGDDPFLRRSVYRLLVSGRWFDVPLSLYESTRAGDTVSITYKPYGPCLLSMDLVRRGKEWGE